MTEPEIQAARVEAVARAMCRAAGVNPERKGVGYPKMWEVFSVRAEEYIAAFQALHEFEFRRANNRPGPYGRKALP